MGQFYLHERIISSSNYVHSVFGECEVLTIVWQRALARVQLCEEVALLTDILSINLKSIGLSCDRRPHHFWLSAYHIQCEGSLALCVARKQTGEQ